MRFYAAPSLPVRFFTSPSPQPRFPALHACMAFHASSSLVHQPHFLSPRPRPYASPVYAPRLQLRRSLMHDVQGHIVIPTIVFPTPTCHPHIALAPTSCTITIPASEQQHDSLEPVHHLRAADCIQASSTLNSNLHCTRSLVFSAKSAASRLLSFCTSRSSQLPLPHAQLAILDQSHPYEQVTWSLLPPLPFQLGKPCDGHESSFVWL